MSRIDEETRAKRKESVWLEVRQHNGIRQKQISENLNFENRTVNNYLRELAEEGKVNKYGVLWYSLPYHETRLRRFSLLPEEAMTLYLATRLFAKQQDKRNEPAESALYRLAEVLTADASVGHEIRQAAQELSQRSSNPEYRSIFREIIRGYIYRRKVLILYRPSKGTEFETVFSTYLIEPSAIGFSTYIIGRSKSQYVDDIRSYKIGRIVSARMINESYFVPSDFPGLDILQNAWSIIMGETTERVVLRFHPNVKERVLETQWHPSQDSEPDPEKLGYLRWWVDVADTTDMKPWIRGWGSDVEVLGPEHLCETIKGHVRRSASTYNIATQTTVSHTDRLLRLWGKTSKHTQLFHPALYHMFDVAHVAQQLLSPRATARWRQVLGHTLNTDPDLLYQWLPYLIALHDIGKLSPPFQILNAKQRKRLQDEGIDLGRPGQPQHHTIVGRLLLNKYTANWPTNLRHAFLDMISGHHGIYQPEGMQDQTNFDHIQEPPEWATLRQHAMQLLESFLCQQWPDALPNPTNVSSAIVTLNGFCILCDWLGSDGNYFTPKPNTPFTEYVIHSRHQAFVRVKDAGLFQTAVSHAPTTFNQLFRDFTSPARPLQQAIEYIPEHLLTQPTLTLIEAPTGEGKTEAAMLLARRIAAQHGTDEMYIALPTTATSNAMHKRIATHLQERLGLPTEVQLIHGQSFLQEDDVIVNSLVNGETTAEDEAAENWFAPKKKALLAPVGVGTIDQAELSALNVRHNALRLIGLAGKTIILDEVHAYDTYMTTIIKRMLSWLAALGSSVILLSATLPKAKRRDLITAFAPVIDTSSIDLDSYPNLLTIGAETIYTPTAPISVFQPDKRLRLNSLAFTNDQAQEKADWLLHQVEDGGCVCWITNTVNRAQSIFQALQDVSDIDLTLLHSRYPLTQRQAIEEDILQKYGKPGDGVERPCKGIVIGTQVLEQSLDLDFDVMVTDLAPIDLILQRAGRLHRHQRNLDERYTHTQPHLYINMIRDKADQAIYSDYILQMTERALQSKEMFTLPIDYRSLIETVYTEAHPDREDTELYQAWDKLDDEAYRLETEAHMRLADEPLADYPFYRSVKLQGFSEDEDSTAWTVAQTRWSERDTITLIPLVKSDDSATVAGGENKVMISLTTKAPRDQQLYLLRHSLRVSNPKLVQTIKAAHAENPYPLFDSALLKNVYPLWLILAEGETAVFTNHNLAQPVHLHSRLGLVFGEYQKL